MRKTLLEFVLVSDCSQPRHSSHVSGKITNGVCYKYDKNKTDFVNNAKLHVCVELDELFSCASNVYAKLIKLF